MSQKPVRGIGQVASRADLEQERPVLCKRMTKTGVQLVRVRHEHRVDAECLGEQHEVGVVCLAVRGE